MIEPDAVSEHTAVHVDLLLFWLLLVLLQVLLLAEGPAQSFSQLTGTNDDDDGDNLS